MGWGGVGLPGGGPAVAAGGDSATSARPRAGDSGIAHDAAMATTTVPHLCELASSPATGPAPGRAPALGPLRNERAATRHRWRVLVEDIASATPRRGAVRSLHRRVDRALTELTARLRWEDTTLHPALAERQLAARPYVARWTDEHDHLRRLVLPLQDAMTVWSAAPHAEAAQDAARAAADALLSAIADHDRREEARTLLWLHRHFTAADWSTLRPSTRPRRRWLLSFAPADRHAEPPSDTHAVGSGGKGDLGCPAVRSDRSRPPARVPARVG